MLQSMLASAHLVKLQDSTALGLCLSGIASVMASAAEEKQAQRSKRRPAGLDLSSSVEIEQHEFTTQEGFESNSSSSSSASPHSPKRQRRATSNCSSPREYRYYCTSCPSSFDNKFTWKTHEDQVHGRRGKYPCPNPSCAAVFFDPDSFKRHHKETHGCGRCGHSQTAFQAIGQATRGYGCGVCGSFFLASHDGFIDHVAKHWEAGVSRRQWYHSRVISALLHRPGIREAWLELLREMYVLGAAPGFHWDESRTGCRSAGRHHDSVGHGLQEALEMFGEVPGVTAADVVVLAHDMAVRVPRAELTTAYTTQHKTACGVYQLNINMGRELHSRSYAMHVTTQAQMRAQAQAQAQAGQQYRHHHHHYLHPGGQQQQQYLAGLPTSTYAESERWKQQEKGIHFLSPAPLLRQQSLYQQHQCQHHHAQQHQQPQSQPHDNIAATHRPHQHQEPGGGGQQQQQLLSGLGLTLGGLISPQYHNSQFSAPPLPFPLPQQQQQHGNHIQSPGGAISPVGYLPAAAGAALTMPGDDGSSRRPSPRQVYTPHAPVPGPSTAIF